MKSMAPRKTPYNEAALSQALSPHGALKEKKAVTSFEFRGVLSIFPGSFFNFYNGRSYRTTANKSSDSKDEDTIDPAPVPKPEDIKPQLAAPLFRAGDHKLMHPAAKTGLQACAKGGQPPKFDVSLGGASLKLIADPIYGNLVEADVSFYTSDGHDDDAEGLKMKLTQFFQLSNIGNILTAYTQAEFDGHTLPPQIGPYKQVHKDFRVYLRIFSKPEDEKKDLALLAGTSIEDAHTWIRNALDAGRQGVCFLVMDHRIRDGKEACGRALYAPGYYGKLWDDRIRAWRNTTDGGDTSSAGFFTVTKNFEQIVYGFLDTMTTNHKKFLSALFENGNMTLQQGQNQLTRSQLPDNNMRRMVVLPSSDLVLAVDWHLVMAEKEVDTSNLLRGPDFGELLIRGCEVVGAERFTADDTEQTGNDNDHVKDGDVKDGDVKDGGDDKDNSHATLYLVWASNDSPAFDVSSLDEGDILDVQLTLGDREYMLDQDKQWRAYVLAPSGLCDRNEVCLLLRRGRVTAAAATQQTNGLAQQRVSTWSTQQLRSDSIISEAEQLRIGKVQLRRRLQAQDMPQSRIFVKLVDNDGSTDALLASQNLNWLISKGSEPAYSSHHSDTAKRITCMQGGWNPNAHAFKNGAFDYLTRDRAQEIADELKCDVHGKAWEEATKEISFSLAALQKNITKEQFGAVEAAIEKDTPGLLLLLGIAGTGKTTVAQKIAAVFWEYARKAGQYQNVFVSPINKNVDKLLTDMKALAGPAMKKKFGRELVLCRVHPIKTEQAYVLARVGYLRPHSSPMFDPLQNKPPADTAAADVAAFVERARRRPTQYSHSQNFVLETHSLGFMAFESTRWDEQVVGYTGCYPELLYPDAGLRNELNHLWTRYHDGENLSPEDMEQMTLLTNKVFTHCQQYSDGVFSTPATICKQTVRENLNPKVYCWFEDELGRFSHAEMTIMRHVAYNRPGVNANEHRPFILSTGDGRQLKNVVTAVENTTGVTQHFENQASISALDFHRAVNLPVVEFTEDFRHNEDVASLFEFMNPHWKTPCNPGNSARGERMMCVELMWGGRDVPGAEGMPAVQWVHTDSQGYVDENGSKYNFDNAVCDMKIVFRALTWSSLTKRFKAGEIMVVAPYKHQVRLIRDAVDVLARICRNAADDDEFRDANYVHDEVNLRDVAADLEQNLQVRTTDDAQGGEVSLVIMDVTTSTGAGHLIVPARPFTGLSRGANGAIVVGNGHGIREHHDNLNGKRDQPVILSIWQKLYQNNCVERDVSYQGMGAFIKSELEHTRGSLRGVQEKRAQMQDGDVDGDEEENEEEDYEGLSDGGGAAGDAAADGAGDAAAGAAGDAAAPVDAATTVSEAGKW